MGLLVDKFKKLRDNRWYERIYKVGVGIKGFDGTVELIAGIWLWAAPHSLQQLLQSWHASISGWDSGLAPHLANGVSKVSDELYGEVLVFAIAFLLSHGIIKLALVYALLEEVLWAYPYALGVLGLFVVVQIVTLMTRPGLGMAILLALNILIMLIVWGEWDKLKHEASKKLVEN